MRNSMWKIFWHHGGLKNKRFIQKADGIYPMYELREPY